MMRQVLILRHVIALLVGSVNFGSITMTTLSDLRMETTFNSTDLPIESFDMTTYSINTLSTQADDRPQRSVGNSSRDTTTRGSTHVSSPPSTEFSTLSNRTRFFTINNSLIQEAKEKQNSNISQLLDRLLEGYDPSLRPGQGGAPLNVQTDMNVRSMGPISEVNLGYSMDAYFRQTWKDERLRFDMYMPNVTLAVHNSFLDRIWKPDTYFFNGRQSYLHTISVPNKLLRLKHDGTLLYSMRLTIKAKCMMELYYFPMDNQVCPLEIGSFAYPVDEAVYTWKYGNNNSLVMAPDVKLSQFDLVDYPQFDSIVTIKSSKYTKLTVIFKFKRHMGYFLLQVYVPCILVVVLSWVSFYINREATSDRVGLGITTVLTLTTLSLDTRNDLPKVPYATALDCYIIICWAFVIGTLLEFAGVHYFTKAGEGDIADDDSDDDEDWDEIDDGQEKRELANMNIGISFLAGRDDSKEGPFGAPLRRPTRLKKGKGIQQGLFMVATMKDIEAENRTCFRKLLRCLEGNNEYKSSIKARGKGRKVNSVSKIDKVARVLFPSTFLLLNGFYWTTCILQGK